MTRNEKFNIKRRTVWRNLWQRLGGGFVESIKGVWTICKEVVIWLVCALPYLVLPGVIVADILIPRAVRRRKAKKQAPPETMQ